MKCKHYQNRSPLRSPLSNWQFENIIKNYNRKTFQTCMLGALVISHSHMVSLKSTICLQCCMMQGGSDYSACGQYDPKVIYTRIVFTSLEYHCI